MARRKFSKSLYEVAGINTFPNHEVDTMSIHQRSIDDAFNATASLVTPAADIFTRVMDCAREYISRRERHSHPAGGFDSAGRFSLKERHECCEGIRSPSRAYPFSEMLHGRSLIHVAHELGLEQHSSVVRRVANCLTKKGEEPARALLYSKAEKRKLLAVDLEL